MSQHVLLNYPKKPITLIYSGIFVFFQGILSSVYLDGKILDKWKMYKIPLVNLNESPKTNTILQASYSGLIDKSARKKLKEKSGMTQNTRSRTSFELYIATI